MSSLPQVVGTNGPVTSVCLLITVREDGRILQYSPLVVPSWLHGSDVHYLPDATIHRVDRVRVHVSDCDSWCIPKCQQATLRRGTDQPGRPPGKVRPPFENQIGFKFTVDTVVFVDLTAGIHQIWSNIQLVLTFNCLHK